MWQCAGQAELSLVDGYLDGAGLETLSLEMVQAELAAIRREQNTAGTELSRASTPQPSAMQGGAARRQRLSPDKAEAGRKGNIRVCLAAAMVTDQDDQDFPKAPPLTSATELYERGVITSAQRAVLEEEAGLKGTGKIFVAAAMATRNTVPEL